MAKSEKYTSPYNIELVTDGDIQYIIQYLDEEDKNVELKNRNAIFAKRPAFDDYRQTTFFETRCKNFVNKLYGVNNGSELVESLAKNVSLSMSSYFRYRDIMDIIKTKRQVLTFTAQDEEMLDLIQKSLSMNNVIAPKIKAIYNILYKNGEEASNE